MCAKPYVSLSTHVRQSVCCKSFRVVVHRIGKNAEIILANVNTNRFAAEMLARIEVIIDLYSVYTKVFYLTFESL